MLANRAGRTISNKPNMERLRTKTIIRRMNLKVLDWNCWPQTSLNTDMRIARPANTSMMPAAKARPTKMVLRGLAEAG